MGCLKSTREEDFFEWLREEKRKSSDGLMREIRTVGVLGAGLMGSGIAEVCAKAGYSVVVREVDAKALATGSRRIENSLSKAIERGKLAAADGEAIRNRLLFSSSSSLAEISS